MNDFYLGEKDLTSYIEAEWIDKMLCERSLEPASKAVPPAFVQSRFCIDAPQFIIQKLVENGINPETLLEVGPGPGRVNFELVSALNSLHSVYLVEPSKLLLDSFSKILLTSGIFKPKHVSGNNDSRLEFDTTELAKKYERIHVEARNDPVTDGLEAPTCDLVVCLNVLDQCESPETMVSFLKSKVCSEGVLAISCTYQWSKKHIKNIEEKTDDINRYFDGSWSFLGEQDIEYRFRVNDRYSMLFLSHLVVYRREA